MLAKMQSDFKELKKERDTLQRDASEAIAARTRAEDQLSAAQRELNAKQDANMTLANQVEKLKQRRAEEESLRRAATGEATKLKQDLDNMKEAENVASREMATLKDTVQCLQAALEKEKSNRASSKQEAQQLEEGLQARIREITADRDGREAKLKRELQLSEEASLRLRAELKAATKETTERVRALEAETSAVHARLEASQAEAKKLRERLDASTSYIDALKSKQQAAAGVTSATSAVILPPSADMGELQDAVKRLQQQTFVLESTVESYKKKETTLQASLAQAEKAFKDQANVMVENDMKLDKARQEIKALTLSVDQLKQMNRATESRAQAAERELESLKSSQVAVVEEAMSSENSMAAECKKLRRDLDKLQSVSDASIKKLTTELQEAREERDAALDMLASQQLDAEVELDKATRALKEENGLLKQSVAALEQKHSSLSSRIKEIEDVRSVSSPKGGVAPRAMSSPGPSVSAATESLLETHEKLKQELRETKSKLVEEMENMTVLLEEEMTNHQNTQQELREARAKLDLQAQSSALMKSKLDEMSSSASELSSRAKQATESERSTLASLQSQLEAQTQECNMLRDLVTAKDQKLESLRLQLEEQQRSEGKIVQRHEELRAKLDLAIAKEHSSQASLLSLQEAKKKLEERAEELRLERDSQMSGVSGALSQTQERLQETERALQDTTASLDKERILSASLQKRVALLENEVSVAKEALQRSESASQKLIDELKAQLAADTTRLSDLRDEAIRDAERKIAQLSSEIQELRIQLKLAADGAAQKQAAAEEEQASLLNRLNLANEKVKDLEASTDVSENKRVQAEAAALAATRRADAAEEQSKLDRQALQQALQDAEECRTLVAEAELSAEAANEKVAIAARQVREDMVSMLDAAKRDVEEWQLKTQSAEQRVQSLELELQQSKDECSRHRDHLRSISSSADDKVYEVQKEGENRLVEANKMLFEARNRLQDLQIQYDDATTKLKSLEMKLATESSEKGRMQMNMQLRIDDLEEELEDVKENAESNLSKLKSDHEEAVSMLQEQLRQAQTDASDAKRMVSAKASEVELVDSSSKVELQEWSRKYDLIKDELRLRERELDQLRASDVQRLNELDAKTTLVESLKKQLEDAELELEEMSKAATESKSENDRLSAALASANAMLKQHDLQFERQLNDVQSSASLQHDQLELKLRENAVQIAQLERDLQATEASKQSLAKGNRDAEVFIAKLQSDLTESKDVCRDLELRIQTLQSDMAVLEKAKRFSEDAATRSAKVHSEETNALRVALEKSGTMVQQLESQVASARAELTEARDRVRACETSEKEKAEDMSLLVQQLAESEIRVEELEKTLARVRSEREELRVAKDEMAAKNKILEGDVSRLQKTTATTEGDAKKRLGMLEQQLHEAQQALAAEREQSSQSSNQLRAAETKLAQSMVRERSLEQEKTQLVERFNRERDDQLDKLRHLQDDSREKVHTLSQEREALERQLKDVTAKHAEQSQALVLRERRVAQLEDDVTEMKTKLSEATEALRDLQIANAKMLQAEERMEKLSAQAEAEVRSLRERLVQAEAGSLDAQSEGTQWKHRAERAEQESSLAQKERDRLREELRSLKETMSNLQSSLNERADEVAGVKQLLDEERQSKIRTERSMVDQQKLIAGHLEKNAKLNAMIEEQKEHIAGLNRRLQELEAAGSQASQVLTLQKDLAKMTSERDSAKVLLNQKAADLQKMQTMLMSYEEKVRSKETSESHDWADKYNTMIQENKKLEKQLKSAESKYAFLKKKVEKLEQQQQGE